jgi:hypothetical protein
MNTIASLIGMSGAGKTVLAAQLTALKTSHTRNVSSSNEHFFPGRLRGLRLGLYSHALNCHAWTQVCGGVLRTTQAILDSDKTLLPGNLILDDGLVKTVIQRCRIPAHISRFSPLVRECVRAEVAMGVTDFIFVKTPPSFAHVEHLVRGQSATQLAPAVVRAKAVDMLSCWTALYDVAKVEILALNVGLILAGGVGKYADPQVVAAEIYASELAGQAHLRKVLTA